jgi:MSHA biogenesis protein MshN
MVEQGESQFSIEPNIKWQDQQQAQQANQLVAQGQIDSAIEKLQHYIATAAQPRQSVKTLMDIFAVQENASAIQTLLAQANYLAVDEKSFYNAKIAVIQQNDAQAIRLLEAHLGEAEHNENYRALLAGLYQRTGMHLEAANHYRRLLSVFGDKPAYWLGFALSQDALNQSKVASQAFQRVNQYTDLQPEVRTYVQQRIAALQE